MTTKIRILLAEDQAMVRGALTALLRLEGPGITNSFEVTARCSSTGYLNARG